MVFFYLNVCSKIGCTLSIFVQFFSKSVSVGCLSLIEQVTKQFNLLLCLCIHDFNNTPLLLFMYTFIMHEIVKLFRLYLIPTWDLWISEATVDLTNVITNKSILFVPIFIFSSLSIFYVKLSIFCLSCIFRFLSSIFKVFTSCDNLQRLVQMYCKKTLVSLYMFSQGMNPW